ncbi:TPA: UDP-N-acetylglucosamine--undecaprenyl-phosphate N-acetylglucosaminephosphotransferase [Mannheimia haemolytica]|uniref:Undecaprenyl-phosphate alpha-N-acetylglucosaminyl 1-phosphate transferase n=1 Tax=Mannheimia haemolytica TaxID=75985 RepID=A0A248ZWD6_MANHA|nr:UDP-N-acetylglucosamine--undecaprenyl-phosphate N-acetylglucosaminephosphotransferase [Mannheimia haemolytica]AWW70482.1 undecaprenyl-phosphate alpha-N-acetylglucosaminyl 1-phosphate transferase [Pasteurellaceae bacterium 12565]AGI31520.1 UDP-N-acetylglucosamine--undecaprenyl-phosphate N-acetylglucosaminephosphotransferase [Mannheimia haemolytica USDA-ARS-USMARC-183]AGI36371.1 UDP-N-acetylglucosamine--undecaprenyl-phosphate N-acetylglucosaminephosphotransferase [Mannheimia haemolytica USDA-AR
MWLTFLTVFIVSFLALIVMRPVAEFVGLVDKPNFRKRHQGLIPLIGGIALFIGNLTFYFMQWQDMRLPELYLTAVTILLIIGVLDDRFDISPLLRAGIQAALAGAMIYSGLSLSSLGQIIAPFSIELGWLGIVFTVFITIGVINAFNMVDGIDGLLAGLSSVSFAGLGTLMFINGEPSLGYWCFALIFVLLPYAMFNLSLFGAKWKVFMGDSGSMLIGFTIIWILLLSTQGQGSPISPITGLWLIAVPLIDMVAVIIRRLKKGKSPFKPDRLHLHHLMMRAGLTSRQALLVITLWAGFCSTIGVLGEVYYWNQWVMMLMFIGLFFLYAYSITHAWRVTRFVRRLKRRAKRSKQL